MRWRRARGPSLPLDGGRARPDVVGVVDLERDPLAPDEDARLVHVVVEILDRHHPGLAAVVPVPLLHVGDDALLAVERALAVLTLLREHVLRRACGIVRR